MENYSGNFKGYLDDLAKDKPSPGGGSVVCLIFCLGTSLIEKAINFSLARSKNLRGYSNSLRKLRKKIYPYIELDGKTFEQILRQKGKRKAEFIKRSEKIIIDTGRAARQVFFLSQQAESGIKKSIVSDFRIGLELIKVTLKGCIFNLEANQKMFGRESKYVSIFKRYLKNLKV